MMTETALHANRHRRVMRRRSLKRGRRTAGPSHHLGARRWRLHLDAQQLEKQRLALEEQQAESRAAVRDASAGKRSGFLDRVKTGLRRFLPRRSGIAA